MPATTYFQTLVLGHAILQKPFSIEDWYLGLFLADPTVAGNVSSEVDAAEYVRRSIFWSNTYTNSTEIVFPTAQSQWGAVAYIGVLNSPALGSGNMLFYQSHAAFVENGDIVKVLVDDLALALT